MNKKITQRYYDWSMGIFPFKRFPLLSIDFSRSWWAPLTDDWFKWLLTLSGRIALSAFVTSTPLLLTKVIQSKSYASVVLFAGLWVCAELWRYCSFTLYAIKQSQLIHGLQYSAFRFFLTVDPVYHVMSLSGKLFSKVERAARAYEGMLDEIMRDIVPIITGIITVIITFFSLDFKLGFLATLLLLIVVGSNIFLILFNGYVFEDKLIVIDDEVKEKSLETLTQVQLVRSTFATNQLDKKVEEKNKKSKNVFMMTWASFSVMILLSRAIYGTMVVILSLYFIYMVKNGFVEILPAVGFMTTFIHGTHNSRRIGRRVQKVLQFVIRIRDLFDFVKKFGYQTFPVLEGDIEQIQLPQTETISIKAIDLSFSYPSSDIFNGHTINLTVPRSQKNNLYGIIGPSGFGKTTLISILGGQLRPLTGDVKINDISMYDVDDMTRQKLVAIQGQAASGLQGTLRDNILLGLPDENYFDDNYLVEILKRVGVWEIFEEKEGLYSEVGEGGLNLSVGQRQRLNFAALYLRTKYYKPSLIMIDEPTSSLDEVSEQAITDMIDELARDAVTFVIAHRINTLEKAVGLMDVSLLVNEKEMIFYPKQELLKKSEYYQKLIKGEVAIEV